MATNEGQPAAPATGSDRMAMFGPHVVTLIDFLGQSAALLDWDYTPTSVSPADTWVRAVRDTMGRVTMWRDEFEKRFRDFQAEMDALADQHSIGQPPTLREQFDEYRRTSLYTGHFSDTLIFYSPLQNEHGYWQMSNVCRMIVTSGALMLAALNAKTVFRGAIEVGMLTRFPPDSAGRPGDPYGPALAKAHQLESKVADYPRIVVGPGVLSYLDAVERTAAAEPAIRAIQALVPQCRTYLAQDRDGCWIVDYLNDAFANARGDPAGWRKLQADGLTFVEAELGRFRREHNQKLAHRYERLVAYFHSRGSAPATPT
jgi:hypothetical protein